MPRTLHFSLSADEVGLASCHAATSIIVKAAALNGFLCDIVQTEADGQYEIACTVESAAHAHLLTQILSDRKRSAENLDKTYHITGAQHSCGAWKTAALDFLAPFLNGNKVKAVKYPSGHPIAWALIFTEKASCEAFAEAVKNFGHGIQPERSASDSNRRTTSSDDTLGKQCPAESIIFTGKAAHMAFAEAAKTFGKIDFGQSNMSEPSWFDGYRFSAANEDKDGGARPGWTASPP